MFSKPSAYGAFKKSVETYGKDTAVCFKGKKTSYSELLINIEKTAYFLFKNGVKKGDVVTVALPNVPEAIYIVYAVNKLGGILHLLHPMTQRNGIEKNLDKTESKVLFLTQGSANLFCGKPKDGVNVFSVRTDEEDVVENGSGAICFNDELEKIKEFEPIKEADKDVTETAFLFNGSGTNGTNSTMEYSDRALNAVCGNLFYMANRRLDEREGISGVLPIFHMYGMFVMHMNFLGGSRLELFAKIDVDEIIRKIKCGDITFLFGVPTLYKYILWNEEFDGGGLKNLKGAYIGGDIVTKELLDGFNSVIARNGGDCKLYQAYGPSETGAGSCMNRYNDDKPYTVGKPVPGARYKVFDEKKGKIVEHGTGELYISGEVLFNGYYKDRKGTEECTYYDDEGIRYLKTGDIMTIDEDGFVTFVGKKKRVFKVSGYSVFPSEIEKTAKEVEGITNACAIGVPDKRTGNKIILYCEGVGDNALKKVLSDKLFDNLEPKAVPKTIIFIERLPVNEKGEADEKILTEKYLKEIKIND